MMMDPTAVVLLGAGASAEAGVPTTFEMTERLVKRLNAEYRHRDEAAALHFVCGALIAYDSAEGADPFQGLDVERVFAAVELLARRQNLEVSPFVSAWHPAVDALDQHRSRIPPAFFDDKFHQALQRGRGVNPIGKVLIELIDSRAATDASGHTYKELAELLLWALRDLVATTPKDVDYLVPLVEQGRRDGGLAVASLNYDLSIEQAGELAGVSVSTGIEHWLAEGRWDWPERGVRLLKLHGSIDWTWERAEHIDGQMPREVVVVGAGGSGAPERPALVFGQGAKLRAEGPFLALLAEFEAQLATAQQLIVIGYSFRDEHVNEIIRRWSAESLTRRILVVDPSWPERFPYPSQEFRAMLHNYLVAPDRVPRRFESRLEVRRVSCSQAIREL